MFENFLLFDILGKFIWILRCFEDFFAKQTQLWHLLENYAWSMNQINCFQDLIYFEWKTKKKMI